LKGFQTPHFSFKRSLFRQPSLVEGSLKPSPTRRHHRSNPAPISTSDLAPVPISTSNTDNDNNNQKGFFYRLLGKRSSPQKAVIVDTITNEIGKAIEIKPQYDNKTNYIYEIDEENDNNNYDYDFNYDDDVESNSSFSTPTLITPTANSNNNPTWSRVRRGSKNMIGYNEYEYEMRNRSRANTNNNNNYEELSLLKNSNGTYGTIKR